MIGTGSFGVNRGFYVARSRHSGGVNFAFADGSIKFLTDSIELPVYHGLGSRNGEESVSIP